MSMPASPTTPATPTTPGSSSARKVDNVWRSVFHPGSNSATKTMGAQLFDKPQPNSPTVYDWLYSHESRSQHR
ncbi:Auxin-repressed protein [Quillaja saponaria]|uniref:Auxin-repressed protein n=1 Tax=Quillaja saponaria TaxID=32244 RepID=A0AAD7M4J3_QUISA|nr:Auxin-repressed protein [Quillaja saponaria]